MISSQTTVVLTRFELHVARVTQGQHVAVVTSPAVARFGVVSAGLQGPVGTVAENVLERADHAAMNAETARIAANEAVDSVSTLMRSLQSAFEYHAGAISAADLE